MKLTVGPLPPAVYWRRRVVILGALLLLLIVAAYSCSNRSAASQQKRGAAPAGSRSASAAPAPSASGSIFAPGVGLSGQPDDPPIEPAPTPSASAPAAEAPAPTGPCTDGEMALTAVPAQASAPHGAIVRLTLRIKNTSNRPCTRDVGVDAQELYLQDAAKVKVWSSDTCDTRHGTDVRTFAPGIEAEFFVDWDGKNSNAGCEKREPLAAGTYQVVARLATKLSEPAPLVLK